MPAEPNQSEADPENPPDAAPGSAPDLRELRYFHHVARTGGFGRAARALNVTQPTVTTQIRKLERRLGASLLTRHGRGLILTPSGASLMARLDVIFGLLSAPLDEAVAPDRSPGTISVGLPSEFAPILVPRLLETCEARLPGVHLAIQSGVSASLEEWILDRRVDIAVLQDPPALDEIDAEPVLTERLGLVSGARDTSLDGTNFVRFRQLAGMKLILQPPRHWIRRMVEAAAFRRGVRLRDITQADDASLIKEMVRYGRGHAILPFSVVRDESARGSLSFRPIEHESLLAVHAITTRRDAASSSRTAEVHGVLRDVMLDLAESGHWAGASIVARPAKSAGRPHEADAPDRVSRTQLSPTL
jgi:LysR family nitrogen assimilation transcriptional regulator